MSNVDLVPGLLIAFPILTAALPLLVGLVRENSGWPIALAVIGIEGGLAVWLAGAVYRGGRRIVHPLGGFGRPGPEGFAVGIELVADALSGVIVLLVAGVSLAVLAYTRRRGPRGNAFYSGYLLLTGGLMGVALTGDVFNLFVFLEISGLATYALVASDRSPESAVAALKYLIIGTTGASLYLVGVGYLYVATGTLNMVDLSRTLAGAVDLPFVTGPMYGDPLVLAGFGFVAVGLAVKAAIFPLHTWQPDAYAAAPDGVTVYISALVSTLGAYAFARVTLTVFTPAFFAAQPIAVEALLAVAVLSVLAGSVLAAAQRRVKRLFAFSSVAQFGLIVAAIGLAVHPAGGEAATRFAIYGAVIHLLAHAIIKGGLFAAAGALAATDGARTVQEYAGLAKRRPVLAGALAVLGVAIVGVPPTVGFLGKWYIAVGAIETELWSVVVVVVASTLLSLLYIARLLEKLYFDHRPAAAPEYAEPSAGVVADGGEAASRELPMGMVVVAVGAAVFAVGLGFAGAELTAAIEPVAEAAIDASPVVADG